MASSSLSAESLDCDDCALTNRRSRIKVLRSRASAPAYHTTESVETTEPELDPSVSGGGKRDSVAAGYLALPGHVSFGGPSSGAASSVTVALDRDSPTRVRMKEKGGSGGRGAGVWTGGGHLHKNKPPLAAKDKRKLREKRRSCGLVHMQSTESTGDSLDENDKENAQHKCTAAYSEVIDADNPQTPEEDRKAFNSRTVRNKSPSDADGDLDADLEDNQDYDSAVSQSETNSSRVILQAVDTAGVGPGGTTSGTPRSNNSRLDVTMGGHDSRRCTPKTTVSRHADSKRCEQHAEELQINVSHAGITATADDFRCEGSDVIIVTMTQCQTTSKTTDSVSSSSAGRATVEELLHEEKKKTRRLEALLKEKDETITELRKQLKHLTSAA